MSDRPTQRCELCDGTGWYGDNGPGRAGNSEFRPCELCNATSTDNQVAETLISRLERDLSSANAARAEIAPLKARIAELNAALDREQKRNAELRELVLAAFREGRKEAWNMSATKRRLDKIAGAA